MANEPVSALIDSTPVTVCHSRRIRSHRVFEGVAKRGLSSVGWFFGINLHTMIVDHGELLARKLTVGNVYDRAPVLELAKDLIGKLIGDKVYIYKTLFADLIERGIQFITKHKKMIKSA